MEFETVSKQQLEALCKVLPVPPDEHELYDQNLHRRYGPPFDLEEWIEKHSLKVLHKNPWQGGIIYTLETCPFDPAHGKDSRIIKMASGAISFGCFHNGCQDKKWHDLRDLLEPGWRTKTKIPEREKYKTTHATGNGKGSGRNQKEEAKALSPQIICLASVKPEEVNFLWRPYIPRRKITLLEGDPAIGKTWLALQLTALISTGAPLPDPNNNGKPVLFNPPANVLYMSAEDGAADTIRPRLDCMGADPSKIFLLSGSKDEDGKLHGVTLADLEIIEKAIQEVKPALLVIDPLQGYLGAGVDMHRANEVRPLLSGLASLAEKYEVAVLAIRHLTKAATSKAIYRGMGSIDFSAAARSILLAGADPDRPDKRAIVQVKNSLEQLGPALGYEIRDGSFWWTGLSDMTAAKIFKCEADDDERTALGDAKKFILEILEDGPCLAKEILKEAKAVGIAEKTLRRACQELDVKTYREGKGRDRPWYWRLNESEEEEAEEQEPWQMEI